MKPYPGMFYTGDGAARDEHGYIWIKGRIDGVYLRSTCGFDCEILLFVDVINVSGHRLSTAEIESALIMHKGVAETAGKFLLFIGL
jgi:acetyl-CoA synthetase